MKCEENGGVLFWHNIIQQSVSFASDISQHWDDNSRTDGSQKESILNYQVAFR